jgi:hypothetical protein
VSLPASSASTIANAPFANYSSAGTTATTGSANSSLSASDTTTASSAIARVPAAGPYDPYGYKASNPYAAATATAYDQPAGNPLRSSAPTTDRYPMPAAGTTPATDSQYASAAVPGSPESIPSTIDKYALPAITAQSMPDSNVNNSAAAYPAISSPAAAAFANSPTPGASQAVSAVEASTPSATGASPIEVTPVTTATVQLPPAGKYRPGGTSDYSATTESQHVEVAALPASPQPASPAGGSDAWPPPASTAPTTSGGIGTY